MFFAGVRFVTEEKKKSVARFGFDWTAALDQDYARAAIGILATHLVDSRYPARPALRRASFGYRVPDGIPGDVPRVFNRYFDLIGGAPHDQFDSGVAAAIVPGDCKSSAADLDGGTGEFFLCVLLEAGLLG